MDQLFSVLDHLFMLFTLFLFRIFAIAQLKDIPLEFPTKRSKTVMAFMLNVKI
jgi:hypothetical protein